MADLTIDKKEYLKKYLSGPPQKSKNKKKKKVIVPKSIIIDDDIDIDKIKPDSDNSDKEQEDEAPIVASVIDDRPLNVRAKEAYVTTHWKTLDVNSGGQNADENSNEGVKVTSHKRHDSDSDVSLDRGQKLRHDSDSDLSPQRSVSKKDISSKKGETSTKSNHRNRHDSDSDISPPRARRKPNSDSDISPPRRGKDTKNRNDSRKNANQDSDSDLDLPRSRMSQQNSKNKRSRRDSSGSESDLSPPRNIKNQGKDRGVSPPRKSRTRRDSDSDISPPRMRRNVDKSQQHNNRGEKTKETLSGLKAGLQDAKALRKELELAKKRENEMIKKIGEDVSGKNAETVFRDKHTGKRRNLKEEKRLQRIEIEKKAKFDEKYMEWGKGLKQVEERENRLGEDLYEMSKPLARYADDEDLEKHLKEKEREGDPMLKFIKKKREKQIDPSKRRPTYKGPPPPPNRFGIPPGYRWDGVDRSNGFEKKIFERQANKIAQVEEAYKWSVMDM